MRSRRARLAALATIGLAAAATTVLPAPASSAAARPGSAAAPAPGPGTAVCPPVTPGHARCYTYIQSSPHRTGRVDIALPDGLGANDLRAAYRTPEQASTTTVAVSIWHNASHLEHDLNVYRSTYKLGACTTADGCLRIVNQKGYAAPLPVDDPDTGIETTLDVSMISAACPTCHILVIEADTNGFADLASTEITAKRLGATVVSNSYGGIQTGQDRHYANSYQQHGVVTVASSGDSGFADPESPAEYPDVVAVGGTELRKADNARGWTERAWTYGSSGCSAYFAKPSWQHDPDCAHRLTADISAAADNIALYDTDTDGWITVSGTSASAPFTAGLFGLAGNAHQIKPGYTYRHPDGFFDITQGTDDSLEHGAACERTYLCEAKTGYDGPTGAGTPNGLNGL